MFLPFGKGLRSDSGPELMLGWTPTANLCLNPGTCPKPVVRISPTICLGGDGNPIITSFVA
jgi:hypothetical protein